MARLKAYRARLILFPRKLGQHKQGDASKEDVAAASNQDNSADKLVAIVKNDFPITGLSTGISEIKKSDMPKAIEGGAYRKLRDSRADKRNSGKREKRAKDKADEAAAAKK